jgi:phosphohistidine swiveling domain-containing protein
VISEDQIRAEADGLTGQKELISALAERRKLQEKNDQRLDGETMRLIMLLRILTLWREERKSFLQRLSIGYSRVTEIATTALDVSADVMRWARVDEAEEAARNPALFIARKEKSVYLYKAGDAESTILVGRAADDIIRGFKEDITVTTLKGVVASQGKAKGRVRVILRESEFHRFQEGEILVTAMTRPEYVPLMRTAIAIVTDEGGLTSHAAIVSRELKKPCVIGTKSATQVFKDGDEVEVNAETGIITKLA